MTLARILRPRGVKGEVAAEILTDFPKRLARLTEVFLADGKAAPRRICVQACWLSPSRGGQAIFHFAGCDSVEAAEKLRGLEVQVPLAERAPLPLGRYYVSDLVGCEVFASGARIGVVQNVQFTGGQGAAGTPLLVVETSQRLPRSHQGELLIPLAEDICARIDTASRRIDVVLPEGLLDLNRE